MKLDFFHDETGEPRARGRGRYSRLASFLESDVQGSRTLLRRIARAVEDVEAGREERWESTGNAYTLTLTAEGAEIAGELDEEAVEEESTRLSLADLRAALGEWAEFLSSDPKG
jgi:uncharacterized protein YacL (UPF0231 family)